MDDQKILHRMLAKGDSLRERYQDFDFNKLDSTQQKYLSKLAFFSRHRERILRKFDGNKIDYDAKIAFLDQHSMKLGTNLFYDLESKRQDYISSFDMIPFSSLVLGILLWLLNKCIGFVFLCGFAIKKPLTNKLYKEAGYSVLMGASLSYTYVYYYKRKYLECVDSTYDKLHKHFEENPILNLIKDDNKIIKNFGFHRFADNDDEESMEDMETHEPGIFEGDPSKESEEYKQRLISHFYQG